MTIDNNRIYDIIGGLIVAIISWIIFRFWNKSRKKKEERAKFFKIDGRKSSKLTPFDLMGVRSREKNRYNKYYLPRKHDAVLAERLADRDNAILVGRPLAGKSRAIFEALKNLDPDRDIYIPNFDAMKTGTIQLPPNISLLKGAIVIFDDVQKYASQTGIENLLAEYDKNDVQIIATCRDGADYDQFCDLLTTEQILFGNPIRIDNVSNEEIQKVGKESGLKSPNKSDGTIGSIFVPLDEMIRRYKKAKADEKDILQAIKRLFGGGIYNSGEVFLMKDIKTICYTEWEETKSKKEWKRLLDDLVQSGFFELKGDIIRIEEVYLEQVIPCDYKTLDDLSELFEVLKIDFDALFALGNRTDDIGEISQQKREYKKLAISIYKTCLGIRKNHETTPAYAGVQNNMGIAYLSLAEVENPTNNYHLAIGSCLEALKVFTLEELPLNFATTQNTLGVAYAKLAKVVDTVDNCSLAIAALQKSLQIHTIDDMPIDHAFTQCNLGNTYQVLAEAKDKADNCERAMQAYGEALVVFTEEKYPLQFSKITNNISLLKHTQYL